MAGGDVTVLGGAGKTFTLHFDTVTAHPRFDAVDHSVAWE